MDTNNPQVPNAPASGASKIIHSKPGISMGGQAATPPAPAAVTPRPPETAVPVAPTAQAAANAPTGPSAPKITQFGKERRHEDNWTRTPNTTGSGAIHVKTFHCKLTEDALLYMDQLINEWLDAHPQYEVKFVHSTIGTFTGKLKEPALICQVWV